MFVFSSIRCVVAIFILLLSSNILISRGLAAVAGNSTDSSHSASADTQPATQSSTPTLDDLVVFPGFRTQGQSSSVVHPGAGCEVLQLHGPDGTLIVATFGSAMNTHDAVLQPTLIYFYGNGMCMADSLPEFNRLRQLRLNVIMVDYQGYGMSGGGPSEAGCYAAADAAYDYVLTRKDVDPRRIVAMGWSLGAAVAIDLAVRRPVAGLITFSAFTSIPDMSRAHSDQAGYTMPLSSRFDNLSKVPLVKCPMLMVHGMQDQLVPPAMLKRLAAAAKTKVTVVRVNGAGHNDIFQQGESVHQKLKAFAEGSLMLAVVAKPD